MNIFDKRIALLQAHMKKDGIKAYIIPATDPHMSEESHIHFTKERFYFCPFLGNDGTLLVTEDAYYLYTDGRYWTEAEWELDGSNCKLVYAGKANVPTLAEYVKENDLYPLGLDSSLFSYGDLKALYKDADHKIRQVSYRYMIKDLPPMPKDKIWKIDENLLSTTMEERIRKAMNAVNKAGAKALVVPTLDDIAYILGYRGNDIPCTPLFYSYLYIDEQREVHLFIDNEKLPEEGIPNVIIHGYDTFFDFLKEHAEVKTFVDEHNTNARICSILKKKVFGNNPIIAQKSVKGEKEIANTKEIQAIDGLAVLKLMKYVDDNIEKGEISEYTCAKFIDDARKENERCFDISFSTIAALDKNAAMMHYQPKEADSPKLTLDNQLLLVDSGGQYYGGTTDTTRTFIFGKNVSDEVKIDYTKTLKSQISLSTCVFEKGCSGHEIDIMAREIMWKDGLDYKCGTGHGVGYMSCVHEGPIGFRYYDREGVFDHAVLEPGHIITIEPGVYKANKYGIRLENNLLVVPAFETEDGIFYKFETITYAPYDARGIIVSMLTDEELAWVNSYNEMVYDKLSALIKDDDDLMIYLKKVTSPLKR